MKREYVGLLSLAAFIGVILIAEYFLEDQVIIDVVNKYIGVWLFLFYCIGQYSMRFSKRF